MTTDVLEAPAKTAIAEYSPTAAALAELRGRLSNVAYDVSTIKGLDVAKKDRAEVRGLRVALEAKRVELKAPALERSRLIDAEAKALTAELVALEKPIDDQIKAEERRKEVEKAAREQAEREAAAAVQAKLDEIREAIPAMVGKNTAAIQCQMNLVSTFNPTLADFGERAGEAAQVKAQVLAKLGDMRDAAKAHEAEQERLAAEREELARMRAEQEARDKAERERVAAEQAAESKRLAEARALLAKAEADAKAERDRADAVAKAARDEEDRVARAARAKEDERLARERAELEAAQREARAAEEVKAAAARKAEQDRLDKTAKKAREAAAAEQDRLDKEAADRRAAEEAAHAADQLVRAAAQDLLTALQGLVNEQQPLGIDRPTYQAALAAITLATGE